MLKYRHYASRPFCFLVIPWLLFPKVLSNWMRFRCLADFVGITLVELLAGAVNILDVKDIREENVVLA